MLYAIILPVVTQFWKLKIPDFIKKSRIVVTRVWNR